MTAIKLQFQFHPGSIKRLNLSLNRKACRWSFNSILVRLKVQRCRDHQVLVPKFRFHPGSIKRQAHPEPVLTLTLRFDSILVRLKATLEPDTFMNKIKVSIPSWFD